MSNKNTMTESQINDFLHSKNPCNRAYDNEVKHYESLGYQYSIKDNHVLCMADDTFNGESAAHIIWRAAQDYSINPQVLIVLLEKEQSLVTDPWPNHRQYAKATGFAVPIPVAATPRTPDLRIRYAKPPPCFARSWTVVGVTIPPTPHSSSITIPTPAVAALIFTSKTALLPLYTGIRRISQTPLP